MKITSCAILLPNGCIVSMPRPSRHHHVLNAYSELAYSDIADCWQGFLTDEGRFVDRIEALAIAKQAGQIVKRCGGDDENLYSENLW